ncbi:putative toxin biosynthesis protein [Cercophora scortea]|uniref:Toxin biosynthesis protein n=1 Tax=Cercophora scortea TaxID=314031 RepID=A0AAE0I2H3_9PEZI|nr:putative toxin biosynthesis protein [Cercophora scortea]
MWRIPTDVPQTALPNGLTELPSLPPSTPLSTIFHHWSHSGAVILKGILTPSQADQINLELLPRLSSIQRGSLVPHPDLAAFHGPQTKRASDLISHSPTFRSTILDNDLIHSVCSRAFSTSTSDDDNDPQPGSYWLSTASTLHASGPQASQVLHRDLTSYPPYAYLGPSGPEAQINFIFALSDFRAENGATRIIPGSNKWDFTQRGNPSQTIAAEMDKGDCLLLNGKVIHGMGANLTTDERKCIQLTVVASFLTPAEAHPFVLDLDTVKTLSKRAQRFVGFRSQYPRGSPGLWTKDYNELALHLGLDDLQGAMEALQEVIAQPKQWDTIDHGDGEVEAKKEEEKE